MSYGKFAAGADQSLRSDRLEDRANQIGLPLLTVVRQIGGAELEEHIISALERQEREIAEDRGETLAGDVLQVVLDVDRKGNARFVRPGDVAIMVNLERARLAGSGFDRPVRRSSSSHRSGGNGLRSAGRSTEPWENPGSTTTW